MRRPRDGEIKRPAGELVRFLARYQMACSGRVVAPTRSGAGNDDLVTLFELFDADSPSDVRIAPAELAEGVDAVLERCGSLWHSCPEDGRETVHGFAGEAVVDLRLRKLSEDNDDTHKGLRMPGKALE